MGEVLINVSTLEGIADAVREQDGTEALIAVSQLKNRIKAIRGKYTKKGLSSFTIKPIDAQYVTDSYKGNAKDDMVLSNCPSLSQVYALFYDKYLAANLQSPLPNYSVTKKSLGKDQSGTYDLWEYDFCPTNWDRMFLISSGMNGYEVGALFGLAYFMEEIVERHEGDALLTYLYEHVRIKVIPFINPWGYAQNPKMYTQSRGVNINRNYNWNGEWDTYNPGSNVNNNKGTAPFSEAETRILMQWCADNLGAEFWIDCHTGIHTEDKELYTSSLTTSPLYQKVVSAHTKLENWAKSFYNLQSVSTNYLWDSSGAMKGRYIEGTFGIPMLTIEQCTKITSIGQLLNGEAKSFINYEAQIYGYVAEFLLRNDETVDCVTYIESLQKAAIANKKYTFGVPDPNSSSGGGGSEEQTPTVIYVHQGSLGSTGENAGNPTTNAARVYTDLMPITHSTFHVVGLAGNGYWFGGRTYDSSGNFDTNLQDTTGDNKVGYANSNECSSSWGTAADVTIAVGTNKVATSKQIRLIIRTTGGEDNLAPSDVDGMQFTLDGVLYELEAASE